jgi:hypothetical protein
MGAVLNLSPKFQVRAPFDSTKNVLFNLARIFGLKMLFDVMATYDSSSTTIAQLRGSLYSCDLVIARSKILSEESLDAGDEVDNEVFMFESDLIK